MTCYKRKENDKARKETLKELNSLIERVNWMQFNSKEWIEANKRIELLEKQIELYDRVMRY